MNNMNNPLMMALQMAQSGKSPMQMLQRVAGQNPQMTQAMKIIQGKNPNQLRLVAENMAKERGINLEKMAQSMGLTLPK